MARRIDQIDTGGPRTACLQPTTPTINKISEIIIHGSSIGTAVTDISALGVLSTEAWTVLFDATGSVVLLPALTVALTGSVGIVKLTVQLTALPEASGDDVGTVGEQLMVAAVGKPVMAHVAAAAALGPALAQVKLPVTVLPAGAAVGRLIAALMSALGVDVTMAVIVLLPATGSGVLLLAVTVADT